MAHRRSVLGVHLCWGTYGFWLPNDPRGSGSREVWGENLKPFGEATFLPDRKRSRARQGHDWQRRFAAKKALVRPAVLFDGYQAKCAATAFGACLTSLDISCWACVVLPDHVHLVVGPSRIHGDELTAELKRWATRALVADGLHPFQREQDETGRVPKCWQVNGWPVWKYTPDGVRQAIRYVEDNPLKEGKRRQVWPFVVPYPEAGERPA